MSNESECYFSCGWCPNTLNYATGLPGVCVQVTHMTHGGTCDGSLNCAECTCEGAELDQLKSGDCTCTCPGTGLWQENSTGTVIHPVLGKAGKYVFGTEEVLAAPVGPEGVTRPPKYWQQNGNPSCPDYHDHVTFCRYCSKDRPNPDSGRVLYNDTGVHPAASLLHLLQHSSSSSACAMCQESMRNARESSCASIQALDSSTRTTRLGQHASCRPMERAAAVRMFCGLRKR
eukprot:SAG31_NODE_133_length_23315_cov_4.858847_15_plen_231_part_00